VLATALAARQAGARLLLVPRDNLAEAALVPGVRVAGAGSLGQVGAWLHGKGGLDVPSPPGPVAADPVAEDLADVRGQPLARRALEVAAAGIGGDGYCNLLNRYSGRALGMASELGVSRCRLIRLSQVKPGADPHRAARR
jgi:hypothetical protein